jgi:4-aminobutyrate--pyruvate transaminase
MNHLLEKRMSERLNSPAGRDVAYHLHPYTDARKHEREGPAVISKGHGVTVYDDQGKAYIEGMAGLWCVALGFSEERLVRAATEQLRTLPYYHAFAHKAAAPSIDLAEKLIAIAPVPMSKAFFANSGSEANDTAIKLVWYYNNALGRPQKKKIISRIKAYHGVTIATASLTSLPQVHEGFDLPIPNILHTGCPHHYRYARDGENEEDFSTRLAEELEALIVREGPETVAAFIGEPVMGAGGVIVPPRTYWEKIQAVLKKHDVLLIADEVICGFGRTGNLFGCETYGIEPDIMTMAKALSSAYLPISAVLISDAVYQPVADYSHRLGVFGHGHTYSAHPVPAAVALEAIRIYEERDIVGHVRRIAPRLQDGLRRFADHPLVGEVRGVGLIGGIDLVADKARKTPFDPPGRVGAYLVRRAEEHGLILRNLGDAIGFCPPLIIEEREIDELLDRFARALDDTAAWLERADLTSVA